LKYRKRNNCKHKILNPTKTSFKNDDVGYGYGGVNRLSYPMPQQQHSKIGTRKNRPKTIVSRL
jgi:hypothetical protein